MPVRRTTLECVDDLKRFPSVWHYQELAELRILARLTHDFAGPIPLSRIVEEFSNIAPDLNPDSASASPLTSSAVKVRITRLRNALRSHYQEHPSRAGIKLTLELRTYRLVLEDEPREPVPDKQVDAREFLRLVTAICNLEGLLVSRRAELFDEWRKESPNCELAKLAAIVNTQSFDGLLQKIATVDVRVRFEECRTIAKKFKIPALLLDPLLSEPVKADVLTLDFNKDFLPAPSAEVPRHQDYAEYAIPAKRLINTDAAFVRLKLDVSGYSSNHEHPGDEMLLVLEGSVEVRFERSGVRTILREGDFIHFYAEQMHIAVQEGALPAVLFIVRFYQLDDSGTRQAVWKSLQQSLKDHSGQTPIPAHSRSWIQQLLPSYRALQPHAIQDRLGLARFLERWMDTDPPSLTPDQIGQARQLGFSESDINALLECRESEPAPTTQQIARIFSIDDFLLASFEFPGIPGAIIIRGDDAPKSPEESTTSWTAFEADRAKSKHGARYFLPTCNLSCSDISIAKVELEANGETDFNAHPGFEALLMMDGEAEIWAERSNAKHLWGRINCTGQRLAHFNSRVKHQVKNPSKTHTSRFLVVRFYRDGPPVRS